jgi:hypothetical protein
VPFGKLERSIFLDTIKNFRSLLLPKLEKWHEKEDIIKINEEERRIIIVLYKFFRECEQQPEALERKELKFLKEGYEDAEKFFQKFAVAWSNKHISYVLVKKDSNTYKEMCKRFLKSKKEISEQIFTVSLLQEEIELYEDEKSPKELKKEILEILPKLPTDYISLIDLTVLLEKFYSLGFIEKAIEIRGTISLIYSEEGRRFANLFQRGYLKTLLIKLKNESETNLMKQLQKFLNEDSRYIFFIYTEMSYEDIKKVEDEVKSALRNRENYVAIHSLGEARQLAENIVSEIEKFSIPEAYAISKIDTPTTYRRKVNGEIIFVRDFSCIWWTSAGQWIYDLVSPYLNPVR